MIISLVSLLLSVTFVFLPCGVSRRFALSFAVWLYLGGLVLLQVFVSVVHPLLLGDRLPFLPLMATSVYCALGVTWASVRTMLLCASQWRNSR